jgi:hypothetical protein
MNVFARLGHVAAALLLAAIASLATTGTASAAANTRTRVECGNDYNSCMNLRKAYVKEGVRIGPMHFGEPGCTAPGCSNEDWFYVYS